MDTTTQSPIQKAVDLAGGVSNLAAACDVSFQAVYKWIKKGYPPTGRCEAIELAVGGAVTRFELLPPAFFESVRPRPKRRETDRKPK